MLRASSNRMTCSSEDLREDSSECMVSVDAKDGTHLVHAELGAMGRKMTRKEMQERNHSASPSGLASDVQRFQEDPGD